MKTRLLLLTAVLFTCVHIYGQSPGKPSVDVKTFVMRHYYHGLPYDEAKMYSKDAVPVLLEMLKDPSMDHYWQNIIVTIGYIGDPSAVEPLTKFMEQLKGEIPIQRFRAVLGVFRALGHISQTGDQASLKALLEYNSLNSWKEKKLNFSYGPYKQQALSEVLNRQAIQGLGISGRPQALQALKQLKTRKDLRADWIDNVDEAVSTNEKVRVQGAKAVFGQKNTLNQN